MPCVVYSLVVILTLQATLVKCDEQPILIGKSQQGTRYYFELWPKGMSRSVSGIEDRRVNGFSCYYVRPYLLASAASKEYAIWLSTMDDIKGYKEYRVSGKVAGKTCFKTFLPLVSEEKRTKPLPFKHPVVSTANQICTENGLLLSTAFEEPVPNGVYYGFIENGMEATIKFDGKSRVQHVGINGTDRGRYNKVTFNMIGKAIHCMFGSRERSATAELILEPIDVTKFDGSRRSFSSARLNTVIGQPFNSNELRVILGIRKTNKLKAIGSQIATGVKSLVRPGSALRMKNGLAAEGIADA